MKKTIVAFSNPFGYGPTGTIIPLLERLVTQTQDARIIFAGSPMCMEIMKDVAVEKVLLDERNEEKILSYLKTIQGAHVIGSQNRFCIRAAKRLGIPSAFIDILAWFWDEIPSDHFLADEIFWIKFPGMEIKPGHERVHLIPAIITVPPAFYTTEKKLIVHIGGAKYPLVERSPLHYFNLLGKGLNALARSKSFDTVLLVGGSDAIAYIRPMIRATNVFLASLPKDVFIQECATASHILTTAGMSSTLESFCMGVPTSFLLPLNLTQIALMNLLKEQEAYSQGMEWENYVAVRDGLRHLTEKEALAEIDAYAESVDRNPHQNEEFVRDLCKMAETIPDTIEQKAFIERIGHEGDRVILELLAERWRLT